MAPPRKVDVRLPKKLNSNSLGARPVHLIITMIKWIRTSRLWYLDAHVAVLHEMQVRVVPLRLRHRPRLHDEVERTLFRSRVSINMMYSGWYIYYYK